jgi:hypothetical protein
MLLVTLEEAMELVREQGVVNVNDVFVILSAFFKQGLTVDWVQYNLLGTPASEWIPVYVKPNTITIDKLHIWGYNDPTDKENPWQSI